MEDFDKAIEDTLIALNTGVLRTRDGSILKPVSYTHLDVYKRQPLVMPYLELSLLKALEAAFSTATLS